MFYCTNIHIVFMQFTIYFTHVNCTRINKYNVYKLFHFQLLKKRTSFLKSKVME